MSVPTRRVALSLSLGVFVLMLGIPRPAVMAQMPTRQQPLPATAPENPPTPRPEVQSLLEQAAQARSEYRWGDALRLGKQAREKAVALGDTAGEAAGLVEMGRVGRDTGQPQEALEFFQQALPLLRKTGDTIGEADTLKDIGAVYYGTGDPQQALDCDRQALALFLAAGDAAGQATTLSNIGAVYESTGEPQKALDFFQQALPLRIAAKDEAGEAATLANVGAIYSSMGDSRKALDYDRQALAEMRKIGDSRGQAAVLSNMGEVYSDIGVPQEALAYFQQALPLRVATGDKAGLAATLTDIGGVYDNTGRPQQALEYYEQALALMRQTGDSRGQAAVFCDIGAVYDSMGEPQKALDYYWQALALFEIAGDAVGQATVLSNMGTVYESTGDPQKALFYFQKAMPLRRTTADKAGLAATLTDIGGAYSSLGDPQQALDYYEKALALAREIGDKAGLAADLSNIGAVYESTGEPQKALDYLQQALPLRTVAGDKAGLAVTLSNIGDAYALLGDSGQAMSYYQRALVTQEGFYPQISDPAQVAAFQQQQVGTLYARTAALQVRLGRVGDALATLERGRNTGLVRLAGQNRLPLTALLGKDALPWQQANDRLAALDGQTVKARQRLDDAYAVGDAAEEQRLAGQWGALRQQEQQAEAGRDALFARLERTDPDFRNLFLGRKTNGAGLMRALLTARSAHTLFLEYAVVDDRTTLLLAASRKAGLHAFSLPVGKKDLTDAVSRWRDSIAHQLPDEPRRARELGQILLPPAVIKPLLPGGRDRSLVIVADGPLLDVPFAALRDVGGKRLVQSYAISAPFSLSMLAWPASKRPASRNLLAVANPLGPIPALPDTERQARTMLSVFQPATLLTAGGATKQAVLHQIGQYRVLHFGVHGEANEQNGLYSRLMLAGRTTAEQELTAGEVTGHPLAAELTVLSACETAQGQKSGGEGLIGLAWAFRAAGCPSVVASQWKVDEDATASLMTRFYQGVRDPRTGLDAALQRAMWAVMREPGHEAPYYWAAFQVMGTTDPLRLATPPRRH